MSNKDSDSKKEDKIQELKKRPDSELKEFAIALIAGIILVVIAFLFVGFGGSEEATEEIYEEPAIGAAVSDLSQRLGIEESGIDVEEVEEREWPDACLGAPRPNEVCAQVITEGFLIVLEYDNTEFEYHTDLTGQQTRLAR